MADTKEETRKRCIDESSVDMELVRTSVKHPVMDSAAKEALDVRGKQMSGKDSKEPEQAKESEAPEEHHRDDDLAPNKRVRFSSEELSPRKTGDQVVEDQGCKRHDKVDESMRIPRGITRGGMKTYFYCSRASEDCVETISTLFENLAIHDLVDATFGEWENFVFRPYVSEQHFTNFHNFLDNGNCWKAVSQWNTVITFYIKHPSGTIYARDTNKGSKTELYYDHVISKWTGKTENGQVNFCIHRHQHKPIEGKLNIVNYFFVDIESTRTFTYESATASWIFKLSVIWNGTTKHEAEKSMRKFQITLQSVDSVKLSKDPVYSASSFLDKVIDICGRKPGTKLLLSK